MRRGFINPLHLVFETAQAFQDILEEAKHWIEDRHQPAGYPVCVNIGVAAGQTIMHVHIHLAPRYQGDATTINWESVLLCIGKSISCRAIANYFIAGHGDPHID